MSSCFHIESLIQFCTLSKQTLNINYCESRNHAISLVPVLLSLYSILSCNFTMSIAAIDIFFGVFMARTSQ